MHRTILTIAAVAVICSGSTANADLVRVSEFDSPEMEGFQGLSMGTFESGSVDVFGGLGSMFNTGNSWLHTTGAWSYEQRAAAYEGDRLMGTSSGGVRYEFNIAQQSFGGFFTSISSAQDGEIQFYSGEMLVGTDTLIAPADSSWAWNGWSSNQSFDRVEIRSNHANAGFLMHDAVRVLTAEIPAPGGGALLMGGMLMLARRRR